MTEKKNLYYECNTCHHTWENPYENRISVIDKCPKCGKMGFLNRR